MRLQWLGVGTLSYYINGILVHEIEHAGTIAGPYIGSATLPVSAEIVGGTTANSFTLICSAVWKEGGEPPQGLTFGAFNSTACAVPASPGERAIMAIRLSATVNTKHNGSIVIPRLLAASAEGGRFAVRMVKNPTITGTPSWVSAGDGSGVEFAVAPAAAGGANNFTVPAFGAVGAGIHMLRVHGGAEQNDDVAPVELGSLFTRLGRRLVRRVYPDTSDVLVITGQRLSLTPNITVSLTWEEVR
jgi:hypothetical protein